MSLVELFFLFFYIGLFSIGGGLTAMTLMQQELIPKGVITAEDFFAMVAVSESTPGPIGVNMATYIGCKLYGVTGGIVLTAGIVLPSLLTILIIAKFAQHFREKTCIKKTFYGLRAGAVGMIAVSCWNVMKISIFQFKSFAEFTNPLQLINIKEFIFFVILLFTAVYIKKLNPIVLIAIGAFFGIIFL